MKRFWAKVDASGDCWLWTAGVNADGYGVFQHAGRPRRAHRNTKVTRAGKRQCRTCLRAACVRHRARKRATA